MKPTWGVYYWPIVLTVMTFAILGPELYALFTNVSNTLSVWVWTEMRVNPGDHFWAWTFGRLATFVIWCGLVFWLTWHFWFGLFR